MARTTSRSPSLTAGALMQTDPLVVDWSAEVLDVWRQMRHTGQRLAVVAAGGIGLGIIAETDLWLAWGMELAPPARRSVRSVVVPAPCVSSTTETPPLSRVLLASRYGAALVVDDDGRVLGLVTTEDLVEALVTRPRA